MNLYLVQHGDAKPKEVDPSRTLSAKGRAETERVAAAKRMDLTVYQIRHSGKRRAAQTAEILAAAMEPAGGAVAVSGLAPRDDVRPVAESLAEETKSVMLVGHLPFLARLAGLLLAGDPDRPVVHFRNSAIVALARGDAGWSVDWILTPETVTE